MLSICRKLVGKPKTYVAEKKPGWLRDLLIDMRGAIVAHLDRKAAGPGGDGYRAAAGAAR
jgi:hypothetical protein